MKKKTLAWAGFIEDKIDLELAIGGSPPHRSDDLVYGIIYRTRREARKCYHDVRRVEIKEDVRKK